MSSIIPLVIFSPFILQRKLCYINLSTLSFLYLWLRWWSDQDKVKPLWCPEVSATAHSEVSIAVTHLLSSVYWDVPLWRRGSWRRRRQKLRRTSLPPRGGTSPPNREPVMVSLQTVMQQRRMRNRKKRKKRRWRKTKQRVDQIHYKVSETKPGQCGDHRQQTQRSKGKGSENYLDTQDKDQQTMRQCGQRLGIWNQRIHRWNNTKQEIQLWNIKKAWPIGRHMEKWWT